MWCAYCSSVIDLPIEPRLDLGQRIAARGAGQVRPRAASEEQGGRMVQAHCGDKDGFSAAVGGHPARPVCGLDCWPVP